MHGSADNLPAEEGVLIGKNRRVGDRVKPFQGCVAFVHDPGRVDRHQLKEDCRPRRKRSGVLQDVFEG
jgi:hypothetical protein